MPGSQPARGPMHDEFECMRFKVTTEAVNVGVPRAV
jgi:hypothetical protein